MLYQLELFNKTDEQIILETEQYFDYLEKPKIGRNQLVTIKKDDKEQTLKYKKIQKYLDDGWVLK